MFNLDKDPIIFCCPECKSLLVEDGDSIICENCSTKYTKKDGIPCFTKGDYYFAEIPENDMDRLINISQNNGWKVGFHDFLREKDENVYKIACDESRLDWQFLFPLSEESSVLDFGCGWGGISIALAQRAGKVVAMDCSFKRLKILNVRIEQENINNILPICGGDTLRLPFPENSFDLIVLNGVLEWFGIFHHELNPREVQLAKLKDIQRVIKNNGSVYIGIENRISYTSFLGSKDHGGLRFTSLMPRRIADIYSQFRLRKKYRTYTYSLFGYRNLLKEAGFSQIDIYVTIPTYRDVFFLADVSDTKTIEYFFKYLFLPRSFKRKIIAVFSKFLLKTNIFRFFVPEFGIIAKKN